MTEEKRRGNAGEDIVCRYLRDKGYIIVARNYKTRLGEIDIIAESRDTLVFVEVKTRKNSLYSSPREAVNLSKQHKIIAAASVYLERSNSPLNIRFDVAEVIIHPNGISDSGRLIDYIENAFSAEDGLWI